MSTIWLGGDYHFGHKNIIKFDRIRPFRPFDNIDDHNREIIARHNALVRSKDVVYFLGDMCFGKDAFACVSQLNGIRKLVLGNHDTYNFRQYGELFSQIDACRELAGCILTHIPIHPQQLERWRGNIHAHTHTDTLEDKRYQCVSLEQNELKPITLEQVLARMPKKAK